MRHLTIKSIEAYVCRPDQPGSTWTPEQPDPFTTHTFIRIQTEDGYVGCAATDSYTTYCVDTVLLETLKDLAPELIGKSATDRVALWSHLKPKAYARSAQAQALIDVALWDLAAKAAGKPLYQLLGASRSTIQAYASTPVLASPEAYVDYVSQWVEQGFRALKFHCWCRPDEDLKMIDLVHRAHGDKGLALMLDVEQRYDLAGAMDVGQILSELEYEWFEAPLDDYDLAGYQRLSKNLSVPVLPAGNAITDPFLVDFGMRESCWSRVRVDVMTCGGITPALAIMRKAAAAGKQVELQSWGHSLAQAANLHLMLSQTNCNFFEMACEYKLFEFATQNPIRANANGFVSAPDGNGLGLEIDWYEIASTAMAHATFQ